MTYEFLEVYMPTLATLLSDGQEGLGAPSFGWDFRPRSGTYLMNVYSVVK